MLFDNLYPLLSGPVTAGLLLGMLGTVAAAVGLGIGHIRQREQGRRGCAALRDARI
jgi:hypothetical protein